MQSRGVQARTSYQFVDACWYEVESIFETTWVNLLSQRILSCVSDRESHQMFDVVGVDLTTNVLALLHFVRVEFQLSGDVSCSTLGQVVTIVIAAFGSRCCNKPPDEWPLVDQFSVLSAGEFFKIPRL